VIPKVGQNTNRSVRHLARETYATRGLSAKVRFFDGWEYDAGPDGLEVDYESALGAKRFLVQRKTITISRL